MKTLRKRHSRILHIHVIEDMDDGYWVALGTRKDTPEMDQEPLMSNFEKWIASKLRGTGRGYVLEVQTKPFAKSTVFDLDEDADMSTPDVQYSNAKNEILICRYGIMKFLGHIPDTLYMLVRKEK